MLSLLAVEIQLNVTTLMVAGLAIAQAVLVFFTIRNKPPAPNAPATDPNAPPTAPTTPDVNAWLPAIMALIEGLKPIFQPAIDSPTTAPPAPAPTLPPPTNPAPTPAVSPVERPVLNLIRELLPLVPSLISVLGDDGVKQAIARKAARSAREGAAAREASADFDPPADAD